MAQQHQQQAFTNQMIITTAQSIFAQAAAHSLVAGIELTQNDLRGLANAAMDVAPYFAERLGLLKVEAIEPRKDDPTVPVSDGTANPSEQSPIIVA